MSFLKKIADEFFETDETAPKPTIRSTSPSIPTTPVKYVNDSSNIEKFIQHFEELFAQRDLPGPDYYEFWKMMEAMPDSMSDEVKITACYAALSSQKLNKETLLSTAKYYIDKILEDEKEFLKAIAEKIKTEIGSKQEQLDKNKLEILKKKDAIRQLETDITNIENGLAPLQSEIETETAKIEINKSSYEKACKAMTDKILNDIETIKLQIK